MAPPKRRAGKAAACQKWSLGDLVLAKVKGFPAWPAKISKPEEWGHTHDPRKVFVYFFGTKEIAFCGPADIQTFTLESKNKLLAKCRGKATSDFTRAVEEICGEYDQRQIQNLTPDIHKSKARSCGDSSSNSAENIHTIEDIKLQSPTYDSGEMLDGQKCQPVRNHGDAFVKKNDLNRRVHRQPDSQRKEGAVGTSEKKERPAPLIKTCAKKEENMLNEVPVGVKKHKSVATPKTSHMRISLKEEKTTNHSENRTKFDLSCTSYTRDESEIQKTKRNVKIFLESSNYAYDYRENTTIDSPLLKQNRTFSAETGLISEHPLSELQLGYKGRCISKETSESHLLPQSGLDVRKMSTSDSPSDFEYSRYGYVEGNIQVSELEEHRRKQEFETIHVSPILNDKNHVLSPYLNKTGAERVITDNFSHPTSILKKKRKLLKKHNPGASDSMKTSVEATQTKVNVSTEDENVFEILSGTDHRKKRSQLKGRKHKLNFDENLRLAKRARSYSEDETIKVLECIDKGCMMSVSHNVGKNTTVNSELSQDKHVKSNDATCSNSPQAEGSSPHGQESSTLLEKATCLPPKADKYRLRSSLPGDEAALPPSKRRHRAQEAMSACVAAAATASADPVTIGAGVEDGARGNSSDEKPFTECPENEGKLEHGNGDCIKGNDTSLPVESTGKVIVKKSVVSMDPFQSYGSLHSETSICGEEKHMDPKVEDSKTHTQRDKRQKMDDVDVNAPAKMSDGLLFSFPKMNESKQNGTFAPMLPSPKKQDGSEITLRKGNSPQPSPMKAHGVVKFDADQYEHKSKNVRVKKSSITPAKKNGAGSKKDHGQSALDKVVQGHLYKHSVVCKNEQASPIRSGGVETSVDKVLGSSKLNLKMNGAAAVKCEGVSHCTDIEKGNKLREAYGASKEVKFKTMSKESDITAPSTSLKHLIAAAQAKREQARSAPMPPHVLNEEIVNSIPAFLSSPSPIRGSSSHHSSPLQFHSGSMAPDETKNAFPSVESRSPKCNAQHWGPTHVVDLGLSEERKISSERKSIGGMLSGDTEATVARDTFEGMLETLSRTKESIGRATRHAIDCAKYGIACEVVELLVQRLENESSFHRRIDLFFLVDSITQCSHSQKGIAGASYIPAVQGALPRLLAAAAPSANVARENRRQCLKVLRLWLERKILPESIVRPYVNELESSNDDRTGGILPRRPRVERAVDDPMREIEGKLDEYGSNATFHLPGLSMNIFEDEEDPSASDWKNNDNNLEVQPAEVLGDQTKSSNEPIERHRHILEDVDGELEMEDVSPTSEYDAACSKDHILQPTTQEIPHCPLPPDQINPCPPLPLGSPPLPEDPPPSPPPLPPSPPPPPPNSPPPPPPPLSPPFVCQPPLPHHYLAPLNDYQLSSKPGNNQQPSHIVSNATMVDSVSYSSSGFPVSQMHPGQNVTSFNSPHSAALPQQLPMNNSNMSFSQQSYRPPPPTIALSSQFSYVRAEIQNTVHRTWLASSSPPTRESEKRSASEDQWRLLHNDRSTRLENQLPIHHVGGGKTTICTSSSFGQEVSPGIFWPSGGAQYPCGSQLPTQNIMVRAPGGPVPNMDVGYTTYSDQGAGLTGGLVAAPTNQVMIQMLSSRSGISAANTWRPT